MGGRSPEKARESVPGPGSYSTNDSPQGKAYSLGAKIEDKLNSFTPGPGAYNDERPKSAAPAYSMYGRPQTKVDSYTPGTILNKAFIY
jgi:hypothetical protein